MSTDIDLFEQFETLPEELKRVLTKYEECDNDYNVMAAMQAECEAIGYTFDYYLDAEPYNLRPLKGSNTTPHPQEIKPTVERLTNGQYMVKLGALTLVHSIVDDFKFNDCTESKGTWAEMCNPHDTKFKSLFIALHNFKSNQ